MNCETMSIVGEKNRSRMNFGECNYHSLKTKMFQNSVTKGVKSLKAEWWQDKSWPTLGPTQFQTQTVKVQPIACFDLKKNIYSMCSSS